MTRIFHIGALVLLGLFTAIHIFNGDKANASPLEKIHQEIVTDYPDISHISRAGLEKELPSGDVLILDTRPVKEYDISHIEGALQVDPNISPEVFRHQFGHVLKNKKLIVYCSVGQRSTILGHRLQSTALAAGAISVQNMKGGLFGWHNDNRALVNASGRTSNIHPYNDYWGRLIKNKEDIRYSP